MKAIFKEFRAPLSGGALALLCLATSSCGLLGMGGKVDETNGKLDRSNQTTQQMNDLMAKVLSELEATRTIMEVMRNTMATMSDNTAHLSSGVDQTNSAVNKTNSEMSKTTAAIHQQILLDSLKEVLSPDNTKSLSFTSPSPPTGMIPAGKKFAEEATPDELVQLNYVFLRDVGEVKPDDAHAHDPATLDSMDRDKFVKLMALQVIDGFAPETSVKDAIQEQITDGGQYSDTVYSFLMLRVMFIDSILVDSDMKTLTDHGEIEEAYKQISYVDWICRLPFRDQIGLKVIGMLVSAHNAAVTARLDHTMIHLVTAVRWEGLAAAIVKLDPSVANTPEIADCKARVKTHQDYWAQNP